MAACPLTCTLCMHASTPCVRHTAWAATALNDGTLVDRLRACANGHVPVNQAFPWPTRTCRSQPTHPPSAYTFTNSCSIWARILNVGKTKAMTAMTDGRIYAGFDSGKIYKINVDRQDSVSSCARGAAMLGAGN